ncbi:MAG: TM0106 family RecB-like putative nuclease, partial [Synechococcus sp.]
MAQRSGIAPPSAPLAAPLTDRLLRGWLRCRRRSWLDRHGPAEERLWTAHRALALQDQLRSFQTLVPSRPGHGEAACARGDEGVVGLRLRGQVPGPSRAPLLVEAHPSLLQRVEGDSRWGAFRYRPVLARQGRRVTREHRLVLALWGRLLAEHQQAAVPHGLVVAGEGRQLEMERLALSSGLQRQLDDTLLRLAQELERPQPPPLVNDRKKCTLCSWRGLCDREAAREGHLSEVSGIGGKRRELLLGLGITRLADLAAADPERLADQLEAHGEQHRDVAESLVLQAQVQQAGRPRRRPTGQGPQPSVRPQPALPELAAAPGVLLYDIESDPDARDDFLHGLLILRLRPEGQAASGDAASGVGGGAAPRWPGPQAAAAAPYRPLLALQEQGEERLWRRLAGVLARHPGWPLLHYGETEAVALLRLTERQGASAAQRSELKRRLIDVHQRLKRHWLLPVNSYGLKAVAGWLGFQWSQSGVDGARCLLW